MESQPDGPHIHGEKPGKNLAIHLMQKKRRAIPIIRGEKDEIYKTSMHLNTHFLNFIQNSTANQRTYRM